MSEYVLVARLNEEYCFDWIVQKPYWKNSEPNSLLANIDNALIFTDLQEAENFAKEFGRGHSLQYKVFTKEEAILHQVMDE